MNAYKIFMDAIATRSPVERITLEGGQTQGHVTALPSKPIQRPRLPKGNDYAKKFQEQDELEDEEYQNGDTPGNFSTVDDLTTLGTTPNINDVIGENLTHVYDSYNFTKPKEVKLQVHEFRDTILEQIDSNQVIIIKGATGCGKTTQIPQFVLDDSRAHNTHCNIIVTQPRRIAAISVARRVCEERRWSLGSLVGYQISLEKVATKDTRLLYCTAGVLLQILVSQKTLMDYTHIFIDEVHERDNETDFILILLKKFLRRSGNRVKLILMSATINTDKFASYFSKKINGQVVDPPVINLHQETQHAVSYYYLEDVQELPIKIHEEISESNPSIQSAMYDLAVMLVEVFRQIDKYEKPLEIQDEQFAGSVLIFLPGLHEIETMHQRLTLRSNEGSNVEQWMLCPLHSTVTCDEQNRVFRLPPKGSRKIILATNIAESSITVPDVKYVIDFCLMKLQMQEPDTNYTSLKMSWISKSQGCQRAGRVGRVMPGRVYRLVPKHLYQSFEEECYPEILRCPLDRLVLKSKELDMGSPVEILGRAMDPPNLSNIERTMLNLKEMGALLLTSNGVYKEDDGDMTLIGRIMASLPLDTQLSKLIIIGHLLGCLDNCISMACCIAVHSVFSNPFKNQLEAYNSKLSWADSSCSDPIACMNVYSLWKLKTNMGLFKRTGGQSEQSWAKNFFVQVKYLKEVARLETEISRRLTHWGIRTLKEDESVNSKKSASLLLKVALAGAFYPNYFAHSQPNEKEAVKLLGGRDPFSTVYLTNFPTNHPGPLYTNVIKQHFTQCGSDINVAFDGSSRVYLSFGSSIIQEQVGTDRQTIPGKIIPAVYRAIKLRLAQTPILIPKLSVHDATKKAKEIFGEDLKPNAYFLKKMSSPSIPMKPNLPGLSCTLLPVIVTHIQDPSAFWVVQDDDSNRQMFTWISSQINEKGATVPLDPNLVTPGRMCIAPYSDSSGKQLYRAQILNTYSDLALVYYVDYGNKEKVLLNELLDFAEDLRNKGVDSQPHLAMRCTLAEIQPSIPLDKDQYSWSPTAIHLLKTQFPHSRAVASVYSVVNNIIAVTLYRTEIVEQLSGDLNPDFSFNHRLIAQGLAEPAEEPYLSRMDHEMREKSITSPKSTSDYPVAYFNNELESCGLDRFDVTSSTLKVALKGPRSPLEISLYNLTKKCLGKEAAVEKCSVNSVLLDTYPMDPHQRFLVAAMVTQNAKGDRLNLRETTVMPNIHGLLGILAMIFAPRTELRTDPDHMNITGALCGLGYDEDTFQAYNPDNDMELSFDVKYDIADLELINKVRFWMNDIVCGEATGSTQKDLSDPMVVEAQTKIKQYLLALLKKRRDTLSSSPFRDSYEWGHLPEEIILRPQSSQGSNCVFPALDGVELKENTKEKLTALKEHLEQLQLVAEGQLEPPRLGIKCNLCEINLECVDSLKIHLKTTIHKVKYTDIFTQ